LSQEGRSLGEEERVGVDHRLGRSKFLPAGLLECLERMPNRLTAVLAGLILLPHRDRDRRHQGPKSHFEAHFGVRWADFA